MLTKLGIKNYRCFPVLTADLRPLTVLIGPNNTGKSAFLNAILSLRKGAQLEPSDHWRLQGQAVVQIRAWTEGCEKPIVVLRDTKQNKQQPKRAIRIGPDEPAPSIREIWMCQLPSAGVVCSHEGFAESVKDVPLGPQGENLASVLDFMLRKDRRRFDGVVATLRDLVPGFEDIVIDTPDPQTRHLGVILDNGLQLPGEALSVGLRHFIFFTTLAYHPRAPDIILVEEPELGVHPRRLGDILKLLRSISQGKFCDHPAQVILTTHSPFLLDHVDLDHDQLLIFQREESEEGARTAYPADKERLKVFLDEFMLGEVWFNESEAGLIGQR